MALYGDLNRLSSVSRPAKVREFDVLWRENAHARPMTHRSDLTSEKQLIVSQVLISVPCLIGIPL